MPSDAITKVRAQLQSSVAGTGDVTNPRDLVAEFRSKNSELLDAARADLETIALVKLISEVGSRRQNPTSLGQGDLFLGFSIPGTIVVQQLTDGRSKPVRKAPATATLAEVEAYLERSPDRLPRKPDPGLVALVDRIRPYMKSPKMTISEGIAAWEAAQAQSKQ